MNKIKGAGSETSFNPYNASGLTSLDLNRSVAYALLTYSGENSRQITANGGTQRLRRLVRCRCDVDSSRLLGRNHYKCQAIPSEL